MRRNRRVKVVATLGPASSATEMIERLFLAGVDVFRINMSHSSHETARALQNSVALGGEAPSATRSASSATCRARSSASANFTAAACSSTTARPSASTRDEKPGSNERVYLPHPQIFSAVEPGHALLLDDGKIRMRVIEATANSIAAEVLVGGALSSRKGISLPDTRLPVGPLTDQGPHRPRLRS